MKKCFIFTLLTFIICFLTGITNDDIDNNHIPKGIGHNVAISTNNIENGEYENVLPLYNIYDDYKYTYYELIDGGYIIIHEKTGEIVEKAKNGKIGFVSDVNYYFGPFNCFSKIGDQYYDVYNKKYVDNFEEKYSELSNKIDVLFDEEEFLIKEKKQRNINTNIRYSGNNPEYNGYDLIDGYCFDINYATLIARYDYFLSNPWISSNGTSYYGNTGICGPIATQLLLGFLNYNVDRRVLPDNYLNGYDYTNNVVSDYSKNPNYCDNPDDMNMYVIGSSSDLSNQYSFINRLCNLMMTPNTDGTYFNDLTNSLYVYLDERLIYGYGVNIYTKYSDSSFFSNVKANIDSDNPIILRTILNSPYDEHYVVCYGYTEYYIPEYNYTYYGFMIHNGWINIFGAEEAWVNSIWCDCGVSIELPHTHNYDSRVLSPNSSTYEYRCSTCGHRTTHVIDYNYESNANRLFEKNITLDGKINRIEEFYFKPNVTSNRIMTTLGLTDVKMRFRMSNGTLIDNDDDSGYSYNPMINVSLTANTWYKIQIILNEYIDEDDQTDPINLLLLIVNSNRDQTDSYSQLDLLSGSTTSYLERNESMIFRYIPPSTGNYTFTTDYSDNSIVDTYMYIYSMTDITAKAYNDDGAGNSQSTITINMTYDEGYVIIVTAYNPQTQNGVVSLLLNNNRAQLPSSIKTSRVMRSAVNVTSTSGTYTDKYGNSAYKVTDSSMTSSGQPKFVLDLTNLGINLPTLQYSTYQTVILFIQFSVYEISDGYQHIYIRNQSGNNYVTPLTSMEHGSGYKDGNYTTYVFYAEIPKSSINSTYLEINFSASGSGNDDWVFINPVVRAGYSSQTASNSSIMNFEGLCVKDF